VDLSLLGLARRLIRKHTPFSGTSAVESCLCYTNNSENWGDGPSDWSLSELLVELTVTASVAALTLTIIRTLVIVLFSEPVANGFGPATSLAHLM
jgi:hypothetical protein